MNPSIELRDIHLPDPVSIWPPAPGWWVLAALLAALSLTIIVALRRRRRRARVRREALVRLDGLARAHVGDDGRFAAEVSLLLRRACLAVYRRDDVAGLTGDRWLGFLDTIVRQSAGDASVTRFSDGPGRALITAPFRPGADIDRDAVLREVRMVITALPDVPEAGA